jgi:hypothetical protein
LTLEAIAWVAMKVLAITSVIAFFISLPMRWYKNSWLGASALDTPPIMQQPQNKLLFLTLTFSLTCFGLFGIWYFFGLWLAISAFCMSWLASKASSNRQFNFEVERVSNSYYRQMLEAKSRGGKPRELGLSPKRPEDISTWDEEDMNVKHTL